MATGEQHFLQPSASSLATALAAAFNIVKPHISVGLVVHPTGPVADTAKGFATLVGDCAKIMHDKVAGSGDGV